MADDLIAAATVMLGRDGPGGAEVLMVRRSSRLAFAGGMWVFPGGRLDPADYGGHIANLDAANLDAAYLDAAERRAAAREAFEETRMVVDPASLVRWSHWTPPDHGQSHRFSTAFFVGPAPDGDVVVDRGEIREYRWMTPETALGLHADHQIELAPPTFITLVQLGEASTLARWLEHPPAAVEHFSTVIAADGDTMVALYHGDVGYETAEVTVPGPRHRLEMGPTAWRYLRD